MDLNSYKNIRHTSTIQVEHLLYAGRGLQTSEKARKPLQVWLRQGEKERKKKRKEREKKNESEQSL